MADYTQIDRPYDAVSNRIPGGTSPVMNEIATLFNQPAQGSSYVDPTAVGSANTDANYIGTQTTQTAAGAVETQQVNSNQSLNDLWINTFIRSANWKPGAVGFNIDGQTGRAEFSDVLVRGTIYASVGNIGGWTINLTTITSAGLTLDSAGSIGSSVFVSGQTGWRIDADTAEFNNIVARGEFRTAVLTKDEIHATGGSFLVLEASVLLNNFTSVTSPSTSTLDLKDPPSGHAQLFNVNDIVRIKDGSGKDNWLKVTVVSDQTTFYRYTVVKQSPAGATGNGTFYPGTAVVNYKQSTDGFVLLTSDMANAPYVDIAQSGVAPWSGTTSLTRLGNLAGITDANFGGALSGYGLYAQNGYFTGTIAASTIIGGTIETSASYATSGQIVISGANNRIYFKDTAGTTVVTIGATTGYPISIAPTAIANNGIIITSSVTGVGYNYTQNANVNNRALFITDNSTSNNLPAVDVIYKGTNSAINVTLSGTSSGTGLSITTVANSNYGIYVDNTSGLSPGISVYSPSSTGVYVTGTQYITNSGTTTKALQVISTTTSGSASNSLYISHAATSPVIQIDKAEGGNMIRLVSSANSAATMEALYFDLTQAGTGTIAAIYAVASKTTGTVFAHLESQFYDSSAVGGTQDKKIKVNLGGTAYWIPCYTA